jgi:hypothetical protein
VRKLLLPLAVLTALAAAALLLWSPDRSDQSGQPARAGQATRAATTAPAGDPTVAAAPSGSASPAGAAPRRGDDPAVLPTTARGTRPRDPINAPVRPGAARTAVAFMTAFARPARGSAAGWWRTVAPYLTAQAREDYRGVDPASVPFTRVTGPATVLPPEEESHLVVLLKVPTDAGVYVVHLVPAGAGWAVSRLTPPGRQP